MKIDTSIIISTYNSPAWLEKVLYGYNNQTYQMFELLVADDGSTSETRDLIMALQKEVFFPIIHVWHEDNGFQKTKILNKAISQSTTAYTIMSDGDCIPRKDFVEQHIKFREEGYFLSGGYYKLPMDISKTITKEDIYTERCFKLHWLKERGQKPFFRNNKLTSGFIKRSLLNSFTPTTASWNGHNSSGWTEDILAVNGFDERMQYGGEDRELGERLVNSGIRAKQMRYTAITLHLDHERGYAKPEMIAKNKAIRETTKNEKRTWTEYGIQKKEGYGKVLGESSSIFL